LLSEALVSGGTVGNQHWRRCTAAVGTRGRAWKVTGARGVLDVASVGPRNGRSDPTMGSSLWPLAAVGVNLAAWLQRKPQLSDWLMDSIHGRWRSGTVWRRRCPALRSAATWSGALGGERGEMRAGKCGQ
jgi:hypothetical protein